MFCEMSKIKTRHNLGVCLDRGHKKHAVLGNVVVRDTVSENNKSANPKETEGSMR